MRKAAIVVLAAMFAVAGASVAEAAKKGKRAKAKPAPISMNEGSAKLVRDGLRQVFVPLESLMTK